MEITAEQGRYVDLEDGQLLEELFSSTQPQDALKEQFEERLRIYLSRLTEIEARSVVRMTEEFADFRRDFFSSSIDLTELDGLRQMIRNFLDMFHLEDLRLTASEMIERDGHNERVSRDYIERHFYVRDGIIDRWIIGAWLCERLQTGSAGRFREWFEKKYLTSSAA